MTDRIIKPQQLRQILGIKQPALRRGIVEKRIPAPDIAISLRVRGWYAKTLEAVGIKVD
jgi:hypothetical protein